LIYIHDINLHYTILVIDSLFKSEKNIFIEKIED